MAALPPVWAELRPSPYEVTAFRSAAHTTSTRSIPGRRGSSFTITWRNEPNAFGRIGSDRSRADRRAIDFKLDAEARRKVDCGFDALMEGVRDVRD